DAEREAGESQTHCEAMGAAGRDPLGFRSARWPGQPCPQRAGLHCYSGTVRRFIAGAEVGRRVRAGTENPTGSVRNTRQPATTFHCVFRALSSGSFRTRNTAAIAVAGGRPTATALS